MKQYTKDEFFNKMDWEGGPYEMASYCGKVEITDDKELNDIWNAIAPLLEEMNDLYEEWEMTREWVDDDYSPEFDDFQDKGYLDEDD